ncbi:uncharacterized protein LOC143818364 [Ranitomeya variabilis]|uniref:uncharacterized protein LOC143818364 n=1 Tax=Ranitomeya variabilis TaxID=490064 RepID=UPI00405686DC
MDLRPTQSNLTERETTGSESEPLINPVGEGEEVAGLSTAPTMFIPPDPSSAAPHVQHPPGTDDAAPHTDAPASGMPEEPGHSSCLTVRLDASPQPTVTSRHGRRRREPMETRRNVDTGVLNYLARAAQADGEEAFSRSLARYRRTIPCEVRLRVRGCFQILLYACTPPNSPYDLFEYIEKWQLSTCNILRMQTNQPVHAQEGSEAPPPRMPTPQPFPQHNPPMPTMYQMAHFQKPYQYGHLSRPSVGGWSQPGFGQHGHIGGGYDSREVYYHDAHSIHPYGQYSSGQSEHGQILEQAQQKSHQQGEGQLAQQRPQEQQPKLPPSPPPTYRNI